MCNNAGVAAQADPWFGPLSAWEWVIGVNFWGVVHGCRAFLPHLIGGGHIVNTASIAGLYPGFSPAYDASKHAVVAISEGLYNGMTMAGLPVGVSVLCPGWVRTQIMDADRNWPSELGEKPPLAPTSEIVGHHVRRAIAEGATPAFIADAVADSVLAEPVLGAPAAGVPRPLSCAGGTRSPSGRTRRRTTRRPECHRREQLLAELMAGLGIAPTPTE